MEHLGKTIFFLGILLAISGGILWLLGNKLSWFGNLPGDIKVEKEGFKFYAPIVSMLLVSIILSLLIWLARKFWQ
jgi:H+/Cl- antiporter ClcA